MGLPPTNMKAAVSSRWWAVLTPWGDYFLYIFFRLAALAAIFTFLDLLLNADSLARRHEQVRVLLYPAFSRTAQDVTLWLRSLFAQPVRWIIWTAAAAVTLELVMAFRNYLEGKHLGDSWLCDVAIAFPNRLGTWWVKHWREVVSAIRNALMLLWWTIGLVQLSFHLPDDYWRAALWLIAPVLLGKTLIELNHVFGWRKFADACAVLIGVAWGAIAVAIALMVSLSSTYVELKDAVGYLTGLGAAVLLWMLHTTIHKGLVQMWRYGSEDDASARRFIEPA
jgi:hypothetical protein